MCGLWVRVEVDADGDVFVKCDDGESEPGDWSSVSECYRGENFSMSGGFIGFMGYNSMKVDDVTVKTWDSGTSDWATQLLDDFTVDANGYSADLLVHDAAGNLTYDGRYAFTYDAWNRMVAVTRAYRRSRLRCCAWF